MTEKFLVRYLFDSTGTMDFFYAPTYVEEISVEHHGIDVDWIVKSEFNKKYGICYAEVIAVRKMDGLS